MSSMPDKWLPWWNPIIYFLNDPWAVTQRSAIPSVWALLLSNSEGPSLAGRWHSVAFEALMANVLLGGSLFPRWWLLQMTRFRGDEGHMVYTPHLGPYPGSWLCIDTLPPGLSLLCQSSWVVLPQRPSDLSLMLLSALFVFRRVMGKSKLKANR